MRKIREVLRLKFEHQFSNRRTAVACKLSRSTIKEYIARFQAAKLDWPLPDDMDETTLESLLFPPLADRKRSNRGQTPPICRDRTLTDWLRTCLSRFSVSVP